MVEESLCMGWVLSLFKTVTKNADFPFAYVIINKKTGCPKMSRLVEPVSPDENKNRRINDAFLALRLSLNQSQNHEFMKKRIDRVHPCSCLGRPNVGPLVKQTLSQAWRGPPKVFLLSEWTKIKNTSLFERKDIVVSPKEHTFWRQNNFKTKKIKKLEWHFASLKSH